MTFIAITILFSCGAGQKDKDTTIQQETPKTLQDDIGEIKSIIRSSNDLTDDLYQELVDKTPSLETLEDDLESFRSKPNELVEKFDKYDGKSISYYNSAKTKALMINDSLLRNRIVKIIGNSKRLYSSKTAEFNSLIKQISQNGTTLNDHHSVLKIILTLPLIEKYQDNSIPNKKEINELIKEQVKLIERIDKLTPKY
ncbi:MAG: hypothetical protein AB9846_13815 [Tenuifilaceae bacterium]